MKIQYKWRCYWENWKYVHPWAFHSDCAWEMCGQMCFVARRCASVSRIAAVMVTRRTWSVPSLPSTTFKAHTGSFTEKKLKGIGLIIWLVVWSMVYFSIIYGIYNPSQLTFTPSFFTNQWCFSALGISVRRVKDLDGSLVAFGVALLPPGLLPLKCNVSSSEFVRRPSRGVHGQRSGREAEVLNKHLSYHDRKIICRIYILHLYIYTWYLDIYL